MGLYIEHLQRRWAAGVTDAVALTNEITVLGYGVEHQTWLSHPGRAGS